MLFCTNLKQWVPYRPVTPKCYIGNPPVRAILCVWHTQPTTARQRKVCGPLRELNRRRCCRSPPPPPLPCARCETRGSSHRHANAATVGFPSTAPKLHSRRFTHRHCRHSTAVEEEPAGQSKYKS